MRRITVSAWICFGSGIWTRIPCTRSSSFSRSTTASSSSCVVDAGIRIVSPRIPVSTASFSFART